MILSKSISGIFRSKAKSVLFFILILALTIVLSLSLSVWKSTNNFLEECNRAYKTIGLFEYMGAEYPDEDFYDDAKQQAIDNFDYSLIESNINVLQFDKSQRALGYVEGFYRTDNMIPRKDAAVLLVHDFSVVRSRSYYKAGIIDSLYSYINVKNKSLWIYPIDYTLDEYFDLTHVYIVHGNYFSGNTAHRSFAIAPFTNGMAERAGFVSGDENIVLDITTEDGGYEIPEDSVFSQIADTYKVINSSLNVYAVSDISSLYFFHQQEVYITEGRLFTDEEYDNQEKVCIVSELFAKKMNLSIGDTIPLQVSVGEGVSYYESYWAGTGFTYEDEYTIVGITNANLEFNNNVYIPKRNDWDFSINHIGYTIGQAIIDNDGADEFYNEIVSQLPDRVRLTIYDQGYSAMAKPYKEILLISKLVTILCIIASLAIIIFFGYLFVYRQRDVSDIMLRLGTGKIKICKYFLYSTGFIAFIAASIGSLIAYLQLDNVMNYVNNIASNYEMSDVRFSNSNLTIIKEFAIDVKIEYLFFIFIAIVIIISALISTLVFTLSTFKKKKTKNKEHRKIKHSGHTFSFGWKAFKFSILSIIRGGIRTLVVPVLSVTIILFLIQLANTAQKYYSQLDQIKQDTVITGYFSDIRGQEVSNVTIEAYQIKDLINSGYIAEMNLSRAVNFAFAGIVEDEYTELSVEIPDGFAYETFLNKIKIGPKLIYTSNISTSPEFFFSSKINAEFLDGYDSSILEKEVGGIPCCIISSDYMEQKDIKLGDTIRILLIDQTAAEQTEYKDLFVVGSYSKQGMRDNIYCQLDDYMYLDLLYNYQEEDNTSLFNYVFDSASFTLADASELDSFKEFLYNYGFSSSNSIGTYRAFVVLEDKKFISNVDMLMRQIRYIEILYPVLYVLVGVISLVVSYLLAVSRRKEFAIMRGLGAQKHITFMSFFIEQVILCISGAAIGIVLSQLIYTNLSSLQLLLSGGYIACYIIGCIISIIIMNNKAVLDILKYQD